jgi:hypothetical protein
MAYSDIARDRRRCQATTKDGQPCRQYAVWGDALRRCGQHGGRISGAHVVGKTAYEPCRCVAYPFPHRPGSGLCRWPEQPHYQLRMRPGTHATGRKELQMIVGARGRQPSCLLGWRIFGR